MTVLDGKVALVTGASSGIGEATAVALAEAGATVVAAARRLDRVEALSAQSGGRISPAYLDVTDRDAVKRLVQEAIERFGKIDILVNNAGVMLLSYMDKLLVDEWDRMIDVNVKGVLYGVAAVLPHMKERRSGHIINIASVAGHRVFPAGAVYCGTKFAVRAISEGLRQELAPFGVRVTVISPGIVKTELTDHITDPDVRRTIEARTLTPLQSKDIAEAVLYAVQQPQHVDINEIVVRPTEQTN
ncbi:MAG: SDR family oxidoreductase [Alicyclobacillaceae bacterium]|nr:SDR family oxidoreductase [Alicyclobacillaceae bacterium]